MKKILLIICVLLAHSAFAQVYWTVNTVPNTRLQSNQIHVSDPDGYLSDSTESVINDALCSIRDRADVFVVTLNSIGDEEPKHFATTLFNYWGIGDAETNNGVLLLFVEEQRALEFETGYGAEETLTDARCSRIFNNTIVPYFRAGDYEGGLCAGVADIVEVFGGEVPVGLMSNLASHNDQLDEYEEDDYEDMSLREVLAFLVLAFMIFVVPVISFFRWIAALLSKKKEEKTETKLEVFNQEGLNIINAVSTGWKSSVWEGKAFLRLLVYGVGAIVIFWIARDHVLWGIVVYFTLTSLIQNSMLLHKAKVAALESNSPRGIYDKAKNDAHSALMRVLAPWVGIPFGMVLRRRKEHGVLCVCPSCGADMMREEGFQLPEKRVAEEAAGAYCFTPCCCSMGHHYVLREQGGSYSSVERCNSCGVLASKKVKEVTTLSPTYTSTGVKEITYECQYCHAQRRTTQSIPRLVRSTSSSSSHSHYRSSGGSFGGGRSGGGGYSGRW